MDLTEKILDAVETLAKSEVSKLQFDKTIQAKVFRIVNLDNGEYKVRFNGNIFSAYANDLSQTFKVDDWVYVNVPEGDFSGKKIIMSTVEQKSLTQAQLTSLQNSIMEVSPDFNFLYNGLYDEKKAYGVIAGVPSGDPNSELYIYEGPHQFQGDGFHGLFQQYANTYELIRIQGSFSTKLQTLHHKGNYGIEVEFYAKGKDNTVDIVSYRLDLNSFNGDPYHLSTFSPQYAIIKVQRNYLLGFKSIRLFEEDFEYDKIVKDGLPTDELNTTDPNIFVKDISIQYVERKDLTDTNYYLTISAPKGITFTPNISSLDLQARLIYMGKDIIDDSSKCYWYERDLTVMIGEAAYDKEVGFGWKKIDNSNIRMTIDSSEVIHSKKYKLKVYYGEEPAVLFAEIELFNHNNTYDYTIEQRTNGDDISLQLNNKLNDGDLVGDWFLSYPDGSYSSVTDGQKKNSISVSDYLKYSSVTFYCQVYDHSGNNIIGTIEHTIVNSESEEDVSISYIGEDMLRYDANGDIAVEDSEKERTLQVALTWKEGVGTAYTVQWLMRDVAGKEIPLTSAVYSPPKSMIDKLWVDAYNILHYNIQQKYKVNFTNNTLVVKIRTITGEEYFFDKEILFLKDGDQGTNGTTYVIAIRPYNRANHNIKLTGFTPLVYKDGWRSNLPLRCYVYKDGDLINGNSKYYINYRWSGVNIVFEERNDSQGGVNGDFDRVTVSGVGSISSSSNSSQLQFYVKVQVTIKDKMNDKKNEIYATYPIDIIYGDLDASFVNINTIPSYIKYTSSGITPQFYNNDITFMYNGVDKSNTIKSMNKNILDIEVKDNLYYLKPATSFIFENIKNNSESNIGVLKCEISTNQFIIHPIIMYLDVYGNEAISGWDGTALDTGDGKYVFAPQVGAGEKDSYNRFTGVVMGKDSGQDKIGLYGYQAGVNVFGLMENGKAYFGAKAGGGQIVLDGRYATIFGGDVTLNENNGKIGPAANGMYIVLADKNPNKTTKAIGIGYSTHENEQEVSITEENFFVTYDGKVRATDANIQGHIYANSGQIGGIARRGGWTIDTNRLYSGSGSTRVELNSDPNTDFAIWAGKTSPGSNYIPSRGEDAGNISRPAPFVVTRDGFVHATNVKIKGNIEANTLKADREGTIGGWNISRNKITSVRNGVNGIVGMASSGNAVFWIGRGMDENTSDGESTDTNIYKPSPDNSYFLVTRSGKLYCAQAEIRGSIFAEKGTIGGWKIYDDRLESKTGNSALYSNGNIKFANGTLYGDVSTEDTTKGATRIEATGGISIDAKGGNLYQSATGYISLVTKGTEPAQLESRSGNVILKGKDVYLQGANSVNTGDSEAKNFPSTVNMKARASFKAEGGGSFLDIINSEINLASAGSLNLNSKFAMTIGGNPLTITGIKDLSVSGNLNTQGNNNNLGATTINGLTINTSLTCSVPADSQFGIYARFAP